MSASQRSCARLPRSRVSQACEIPRERHLSKKSLLISLAERGGSSARRLSASRRPFLSLGVHALQEELYFGGAVGDEDDG